MKVTFEIDTEEPQQADEVVMLTKALDMRIALWDVEQLLRNALKYEGFLRPDYLTDIEEKAIEQVQIKFREILDEHDLTKHVLEMP